MTLLALAFSLACRDAPPPPAYVTAARTAGSWQGRGSQTLGFSSDSGRFDIKWETSNESAPRTGTFKVMVHSAVSGRPLHLAVDHRGEGRGTARIDDDPRQYNLMVESANLDWSISVEEVVAVPAPARGAPPQRN
jgi:hypothetical protein